MVESKNMIKVTSSDNETIDVDADVIRLSKTINTMLQDLGMDPEEQSEAVPLQNVNAAILKKVLFLSTRGCWE